MATPFWDMWDILPCGICLPATAFMAFFKVFPRGRHSMAFVVSSVCSQAMDRTIGKWSEPNAYSVRQSMFISRPELARLMSWELLQESVTLVLAFFVEHFMNREVSFTCNIVSS